MPFILEPELPGYRATWTGPIGLAEVQQLRAAVENSAPDGGYGYALIDLRLADQEEAKLDYLHSVTREIRDSAPRPGFRLAVVGPTKIVDVWVSQLAALVEFGSDRWVGGPPEMQRFDDLAGARGWAQAWDGAANPDNG